MYALSNVVNRSGLRLIAISSLIIGLAACGGGGGDSGTGITLPTAPVTITQTNAPQVAGAAIDAGFGGTSLPVPVAAQTSGSASTISAASSAQMVARIGQAAAQQIISQGAASATVTAAVGTGTVNCPVSGTMFISSSGTSGSFTFNNCSDVAGVTINGTLSISNIVSTATTLSIDAAFNLTMTTVSPANTMTAIGDMRIVINTTTLAMTVSGSSLAMGNTDSVRGNFGLQNYSITIDGTGNVTAMTFTFASTAINGTATFTMTSQFVSTGGMFPSSGAATVTGANSTKLKITVLGDETAPVGSQVMLELSTDNGVTYAAPTYVTWAAVSSNL